MAVKHAELTITDEAQSVLTGVPDTEGQYDHARTVVLQNESEDTDVFIGGPDVSDTDYGYKLAFGEQVTLELTHSDVPYAVVEAEGTATVRALHLGV